MDTKKLRQKILDLAIHGKLVPQDPNDEPASVLLERIRSEKERLIKEGKVKRSRKTTKTSDAACDKQEVPFEVPSGWVWTTIGELFQHNNGKQKTSSSQQGTLHRYITTSNVYWDCFDFSKVGEMYFSDSELDKCTAYRGDLLVCEGGDIGRAAIWNYDYTICIQNHLHRLRAYVPLYTKFFLYSLMDTKGKGLIKGKGIGLMSLSANDLHAIPTVLPPLAEQERIATEIERWFNLIDIIEQGKADLKTTIKQAKNKILELAIHGKLVPQDPNDEPASELLKRINPKAEITCDNGHYPKLPKGWAMSTLGKIGIWQSGATPSRLRKDFYGGDIPWLKTGDLNDGKITEIPEFITQKALEETSVKLNPIGSVLIAMYGATIGKIGILTFPATTNQACCACVDYKIEQMYLFYFLLANKAMFVAMGGGGAQPNISKEKIVSTLIHLPPLAEQQRIVAKIEQLFTILKTIEENL